MTKTKLAGLLSCGALVLAACVVTDDGKDGTATNATNITTVTAGDSTSSNDTQTTGGADDAPATSAASTGGAESTGGADGTTGSGCTAQDECMTDAQCNGGTCLSDCTCFGGGDSTGGGGGVGTYGPCDMCAPGETPVGLMGLDGFCACAPACDGPMSPCPDPGTGGQAVCALGMDAMNPTLCVLLCMDASQCPEGDSCEMVPGQAQPVSICTAPVPM